jgi:hypothetical protein
MVETALPFTAVCNDCQSVLSVVCKGVTAVSALVKIVVASVTWEEVRESSFVKRSTWFWTIVAGSGAEVELKTPNGLWAIMEPDASAPMAIALVNVFIGCCVFS